MLRYFCLIPYVYKGVYTRPYPGKEGQMFNGCQLVKEDVVLRADSSHLSDLLHVIGIGDVVPVNDVYYTKQKC